MYYKWQIIAREFVNKHPTHKKDIGEEGTGNGNELTMHATGFETKGTSQYLCVYTVSDGWTTFKIHKDNS